MAYSYEYPYTDPNRYNSDWMLNKLAELDREPKIITVIVGDPIPLDIPVGSIVVAYTNNFKNDIHGVYVKAYSIDNDNFIPIYEA